MQRKEVKSKSRTNPNTKQGKSFIPRQQGADYTQVVQEKRRKDKLKKTRLDRIEEIENKKIEDVKRRIAENQAKMEDFGKITNSNVDEYYSQQNEGISQEEIEEALKIKASRLVPLWWQTIEEVQKLQKSVKEKLKIYTAEDIPKLTIEETQRLGNQAGLITNLTTFISGVGISLANLEGADPYRRSLAIVSSSARRQHLVYFLDVASKLGHNLDLKPLQELSEKLKLVLGDMPDF